MQNNNPAKTFLRQYRGLVIRCNALRRSIREAEEQATDVSVHLKPISVQTSSSGDALLNSVIRVVEGTELLNAEMCRCEKALEDVLTAIRSVPDETQRAVLTMRYVEGLGWADIQEEIHYERTQTLVIHGRALNAVNQWLKMRTKTDYDI